jgi:hypothetical protein
MSSSSLLPSKNSTMDSFPREAELADGGGSCQSPGTIGKGWRGVETAAIGAGAARRDPRLEMGVVGSIGDGVAGVGVTRRWSTLDRERVEPPGRTVVPTL